jgi:hypothetical protein
VSYQAVRALPAPQQLRARRVLPGNAASAKGVGPFPHLRQTTDITPARARQVFSPADMVHFAVPANLQTLTEGAFAFVQDSSGMRAHDAVRVQVSIRVNSRAHAPPEAYRLSFSMYQAGVDFNILFKPSLKPLNPLNRRLMAGFV